MVEAAPEGVTLVLEAADGEEAKEGDETGKGGRE